MRRHQDMTKQCLLPGSLLLLFGILLFAESFPFHVRLIVQSLLLAVAWLSPTVWLWRSIVARFLLVAVVLLSLNNLIAVSLSNSFMAAMQTSTDCLAVAGAFLLPAAASLVLDHTQRRILLRGLCFVLFFAGLGFLAFHSVNANNGTLRGWPLANPNHNGILFGVAALLSVGVLPRSRSTSLVLRVALYLFFALLVVFSQSASAVSGLVLVSVYVLAMPRNLPRSITVAVLGLPVLATVALAPVLTNAWRRVQIWGDIIGSSRFGMTDWLFGHGWQGFVSQYPLWQSWQANRNQVVLAPESELLMLYYGGGIVALSIVLGTIIILYRKRLLRAVPRGGTRGYAAMALWLVLWQATIDNTLHTLPLLSLTGLLLGVRLAARNGSADSDQVQTKQAVRRR